MIGINIAANTSKKIVWQCKTYITDGKDACGAKAVAENVLMDAFVRMLDNKQQGFTA